MLFMHLHVCVCIVLDITDDTILFDYQSCTRSHRLICVVCDKYVECFIFCYIQKSMQCLKTLHTLPSLDNFYC